MTEKRETTGTPAKLVMRANRENVDANGEDVACSPSKSRMRKDA